MADYFLAFSEDGLKFRLNRDGSWEPEAEVANEASGGFRSTKWGDSPQVVKTWEGQSPIFEGPDVLIYESSVAGFSAEVGFLFSNGKLHTGCYRFKQEHSQKTDFISDHQKVKQLLITKYGTPSASNEYWNNDLYRDDPNECGMAIASGHYSIFDGWDGPETEVILQLTGDNYVIEPTLIYKCKRLQSLAKADRDKALLAGL